MSRPHFSSMWEMLQLFTHAQCEMSAKHFTHGQCKMAVQGCLRLPKAALTSRGLHEGCLRLPKAALMSRGLHEGCPRLP